MKTKELLSALIQLSKADNYFDEFEFTYLLKVGKHIGLDDDVVESMIQQSKKLPLSIPKDEEERMTILYYMLFLMKINNIINDEEKELVHHYGFKLGFSANMIDDFIRLMESSGQRKVKANDMLKVIRKYQN